MPATNIPTNPIADWETVRDDWQARLQSLVSSIEGWAQESGWASRRIEKNMEDSQIGCYKAPALLLQEGVARILLEPITRFAPGVDGVVDLYLMPAYDDIASLYLVNGSWRLHYQFPRASSAATIRDADAKPLSKETLQEALAEMARNAG